MNTSAFSLLIHQIPESYIHCVMVSKKSRKLSDTQHRPCFSHHVSVTGVYEAMCTQEM